MSKHSVNVTKSLSKSNLPSIHRGSKPLSGASMEVPMNTNAPRNSRPNPLWIRPGPGPVFRWVERTARGILPEPTTGKLTDDDI